MQRYLYLIGLSFMLFQLNAQNLELFEEKMFETKEGQSIPYRMLLPENYNSDTSYPLVIFLHGAGERGNDNEKQLIHGVQVFLDSANRKAFPCIVIAPQCPKEDYWGSVKVDRSSYPLNLDFNYKYPITTALDLVLMLTKESIKTLPVNKNQVYISGLSMGGMGTLEAICREPKLFAAAVAVCGGADVEAFGKKQANFPLWLFHGNVDGVVSVEHSQQLYDKLKKLHGKVKYTEYKDVNHNSWENAYAEPDLLPWLFSQKKK